MTIKELKELIKSECKNAIYEIIIEMYGDKKSTTQKTVDTKPLSNNQNRLKEEKSFCKNPILNSILNETASDPASIERRKQASLSMEQMSMALNDDLLTNNDGYEYQYMKNIGFDGAGVDLNSAEKTVGVDFVSKASAIFKKSLEKKK